MRVRFFRALGGVCSGTGIFTELQSQSLWRTLWHLLLTAVLAVLIMSVGVCSRLAGVGRAVAEQLEKQCGGIRISERGLEPLVEPETMREFLLPGLFFVTYLPGKQGIPENFPSRGAHGVLWLPDRIGIWAKGRNNTYWLSILSAEPGQVGTMREVGTPAGLLEELRRAPALPWKQLGGEERILTASRMQALWKLFLLIALPVALLFETLFQVLLYVAMFAAVFWLMSLRRPNRRSLREVIVLAVYAGFPAMLIGALAVALDLPHLDFNWIYVLGMTGYLMVAMNRLERCRRENTQDA